jgi:hypothetical protein
MKKILLLMVVLFVVASTGFASSNLKTVNSTSGIPQVKSICIDLGDITNMTESELSETINELLDASLSPLPPALQCSVTASAELKFGLVSIEVSVTVSGDCAEIRRIGSQIARQIIAAFKAELTKRLE